MPEGDTIHRAAGALRRAMLGDSITQFSSTVPEIRGVDLSGRRISEVQARGKNLLIDFDDGRTLLTHMRMTGSWHIYRPDERWRKPARQARIVIHTPRFVFVCFNAPVVKLLRENERERELSFLGPDVLADELDIDRAIAGLRSERDLPVGEALLSQRLLAGIGNIYKSETLFSCGVHPLDRVGTLTDRDLERLVLAARRLMRANVASESTQDTRRTRRAALLGLPEACATVLSVWRADRDDPPGPGDALDLLLRTVPAGQRPPGLGRRRSVDVRRVTTDRSGVTVRANERPQESLRFRPRADRRASSLRARARASFAKHDPTMPAP